MERYAIFTKRTRIRDKHNYKKKIRVWGRGVDCLVVDIDFHLRENSMLLVNQRLIYIILRYLMMAYSCIQTLPYFPYSRICYIFYECQHIKYNIYYLCNNIYIMGWVAIFEVAQNPYSTQKSVQPTKCHEILCKTCPLLTKSSFSSPLRLAPRSKPLLSVSVCILKKMVWCHLLCFEGIILHSFPTNHIRPFFGGSTFNMLNMNARYVGFEVSGCFFGSYFGSPTSTKLVFH